MEPISAESWNKLRQQAASIHRLSKIDNSIISSENITLDYSYQRIDSCSMDLLLQLANECGLKKSIQNLYSGSKVNGSENKPALHTALRTFTKDSILVEGRSIIPDILSTRERMYDIAEQIRNGQWLGYSGKAITDVVNIGIGGSQLGPQFCIHALKDFITDKLKFHFISDFDAHEYQRTLTKLNPETTLFIVSSKSFTTMETLYNAQKAMDWLAQPQHLDKHFIAVTAHAAKASSLGITITLPIWDWVGGRFSSCSAINLITCIAIGSKEFSEILFGANLMDKHFYETEFASNIPVMMALLGIWNINFLGINNLLILTYAQALQYLVPYLQQLDMESNGKSINNQGEPVCYDTGPIVWGGLANQAQHSYYQHLCQGTHKIASDFISVDVYKDPIINKMCTAQKSILAHGVKDKANPQLYIQGQMPINHIRLKECTPRTIGALIAMYEHKIFTQSVIWNINSFDQPSVDSSKRLLKVSENIEAVDN